MNWFRNSESLWGRVPIAVVGGLLLATSFPNFNFGVGAFIGVFLTLVAINRMTFFKSFFVGFIGGFAFYGLVLIWLTTYLGPIPWAALTIVEALIFGLGCAMISVVWRWLNSMKNRSLANALTAVAIGAIYTGREYVAGHFPFGGLPWARLGLSQVDNPLAKWVWAIDIAGFTWLIVSVSALITLKFLHPLPQGFGLRARFQNWGSATIALLLTALVPLGIGLIKPEPSGTLRVAAVQGNANAGLFAVNPPGSILDKHLTVARELVSSGDADGVELMVWPENSSDLDPITMVEPNLKITNFVNEELKAPLLFGNKTFRGSDFYNEVDLWLPEKGIADWYDKKRPVPFGEYVPYRSFFMALAPSMIGLIGWDMSPGVRDGIFEVKDNVEVGSLICFEVTIDELNYDLIDSGAQALMIQTNSSDFGRSVQGVQLAAISRMRAIETGRTVVSISTVGVSGIYAPDGSVMQELESFKPDYMVEDIELHKGKTPAMIFGRYIEPLAFGLAIGLFLLAVASTLLRKRRAK